MRNLVKRLCQILLAVMLAGAVGADWLAPFPPGHQFRTKTDTPPSSEHWLGTDALGRDRFSRLLHGTRISLLLAPAAALLAVGVAVTVGGLAAAGGKWPDRLLMAGTDLMIGLPWMFVALSARAALPLDVDPWISIAITFVLMGLFGWPGPARVIRTGVAEILSSGYVLAARSRGVGPAGVLVRHVLPNLGPLLAAQFWSCVPVFILGEVNLGVIGLGVTEPMPSWGTLIRELETQVAGGDGLLAQYWLLAPAGLMVSAVLCFTILFPARART